MTPTCLCGLLLKLWLSALCNMMMHHDLTSILYSLPYVT